MIAQRVTWRGWGGIRAGILESVRALESAAGGGTLPGVLVNCASGTRGRPLNSAVKRSMTPASRCRVGAQGMDRFKEQGNRTSAQDLGRTPRREEDSSRPFAERQASRSSRVAASPSSPVATRPSIQDGRSEAANTPKPRILVVDDNAINRRVLAGMIRALGCEVETAGNGEDAIERLRHDGRFALVFMDCEMPVLDGFEATQRIRGELGHDLPIVAATAYTTEDDKQRCRDSGMNDFMPKPLKRAAVRTVLEQWLPSLNQGQGEPERLRSSG